MTRVLIIGSSHIGAYKTAAERFGAFYPDIELTFFGLRGPLFLAGRMNKKGLFKAPLRDEKDRAFVLATNGSLVADAAGFDHVLLVGHRFAFNNVAALLHDHDVLEGVRTGRARVISEAFLQEAVTTLCDTAAAEAAQAIEAFGKPACFAVAPYPASSLVERGESYALARNLGQFWARPDAAWVFEMWHTAVRSALETRGHQLLIQPDALNAGPYATKPEFANRAATLDGERAGKSDHRHMNADYGLAMLCAYANTHLGIAPRLDEKPPLKERTA
ncbi:MAG: hypothetical protein WBB25_09850 [Sulfitobacter sp.]